MKIKFDNCRLATDETLSLSQLWVENGKICQPSSEPDKVIDLEGNIIAPAFIDLQVNGAYGYDCTSDPDSIPKIAELITKTGVGAFCPTIVSSPKITYNTLPDLRSFTRKSDSAKIIGYHLEGPYLNKTFSGAHDKDHVRMLDRKLDPSGSYRTLSNTSMITLAPEALESLGAMRRLASMEIVISLGHCDPDESLIRDSKASGARMVTHLFNGMGSIHHRRPGLISSVLVKKRFPYSIIVDKEHVHPDLVKMAWELHPEGVILVSDMMAGFGLQDGEYVLGTMSVTVKDGRATLSGTDTLAGSVTGIDKCLKNFLEITGCPIHEGIKSVTSRPAKLLGLYPKRGSLDIGAEADLVVLNHEYSLLATYIAGK